MNYQDYIVVKPLKILVFIDRNNQPSVNKVIEVLNFIHGDNYVARSIYIDELWSLRAIGLCRRISDYEAIYITTDSKKERSRIRHWIYETFRFDAHIQKYSTISQLYKQYCMRKKETLKFFKSTIGDTVYNKIINEAVYENKDTNHRYYAFSNAQDIATTINLKEENNDGK